MMKRTTLIVLGVLVGAFALLIWMPPSSQADINKLFASTVSTETNVDLAPMQAPAPSAAPDPVTIDHTSADDRHEHLRSYTLGVMNDWTHAVPQVPVADYGDIASDLTTAVTTEAAASERTGHQCNTLPSKDGWRRCTWIPGWNTDHSKTTLLAALGYFEGARYAAYVDEGKCNDPKWRASAEGQYMMHIWGDCDGGHAHSIFQIHPIDDTFSPLYELCNTKMVDGSRVGAATCALAIARGSLTSTGDLTGYTGEWSFEHPKATMRLDFAQHALSKHPWLEPQLPQE